MDIAADWSGAGLLGLEAWQRILDTIAAATGWSVLLVTEDSNALLESSESSLGAHLDHYLHQQVSVAAQSGQRQVSRQRDGENERIWLVEPAALGSDIVFVVAHCSTPATISLTNEDIARVARVVSGVLDSFATLVASTENTISTLQQRYQHERRRSSALIELGRKLGSLSDRDIALKTVARSATAMLGDACAVYLLQQPESLLVLCATYDNRTGAKRNLHKYLDSLPLRSEVHPVAQATARGSWIVATGDDPLLDHLGASALLSIPLLRGGEVFGALLFLHFAPDAGFAHEDVALGEAIADRAMAALENVRLYQSEQRAQDFKDEFLSSVSHELRTPLTAILGYSQLIRKSLNGSNDRLTKQMDIIWSQAQRLNRLVETVLDISSMEQGQIELEKEACDLRQLLDSAIEKVHVAAHDNIKIRVRSDGRSFPVLADRGRMEQVFGHLLSNALKFTPRDGTIIISLVHNGAGACIEFADEGPGIDAADLAQVFGRYFKGETPMSRAGGLGLGLYVSRGIIEAHGGTISAQSMASGAVFRIEMPLTPTVQEQSENPERHAAPGQ